MKRFLSIFGVALLGVGCASTGTDRVTYTEEGVKVYNLDEQPQANVTGSGTLMKPAHDPARVQPGQFTGKEEASDRIGQYPVTPRESTGIEFRRHGPDPAESSPAAVPGGVGSLGQAGIQPGEPVTAETLATTPANPSIAPANSGDNLRTNNPPANREAVGSAPAAETGSERNNPPAKQSLNP